MHIHPTYPIHCKKFIVEVVWYISTKTKANFRKTVDNFFNIKSYSVDRSDNFTVKKKGENATQTYVTNIVHRIDTYHPIRCKI